MLVMSRYLFLMTEELTDGIIEFIPFPMLGCKGSAWFDGRGKVKRQSRFEQNLPPTERILPENLAPANHTLVRHPATETSD